MNKQKAAGAGIWGIILLFVLLIPLFLGGSYMLHVLVLVMVNIVLASSLRLINLSGQLSLAHGGMISIGAYTTTLMIMKLGMSSWLALLVGAVLASVVGCIVGIPFTRLKGIYFSMVTVFFGEIITLIVQQWRELTGGNSGIYNIPRPDSLTIPGLFSLNFASKPSFYYLALALMLVSLAILWAVERSRVGLTFRGIQQTESLSESVGINTTAYKVLAFSIGCFFAGLMGGFYAQYISSISPTVFGFLFTIYTLIYMIVGGSGKFIGPIIGAIVLTLLPEVARPLKSFMPLVFAAILMAVIFLMPEGLVGLPQRLKTLWKITKERTSRNIAGEKV
jgi:branched-chain amino acid transport system permease protein